MIATRIAETLLWGSCAIVAVRVYRKIRRDWRQAGRVIRDSQAAGTTAARRIRIYGIPGLPGDGRPLTPNEEHILRDVAMDSMVNVPEPAYDDEGSEHP